jgi:ABC-2 type transport system permease protein
VYKLLLRSIATTGRLVAIAALSGISVVTALIAHAHTSFHTLDTGTSYVSGNLVTLVPVAVLVFASATLGDLVDDGSLVYLWLRPVPTRTHVLAAWAATVSIIVPLVLAPIVLATAVIDSSSELMTGAILAGLVAVLTYGAIFVMLGVRFRRALPWGLIYILIWEGFVASAGKSATKLAVRSYVGSILSHETGIDIKLADFAELTGFIVPACVIVAALAYATRRLARTDVP